ncbi:MAG: hypothetical protein ACRD0G_14370 [Acidimicrobiales bacterium]
MKRIVVPVVIALVGIALGGAIAGWPSDVSSDIVIGGSIPELPGTTETEDLGTEPAVDAPVPDGSSASSPPTATAAAVDSTAVVSTEPGTVPETTQAVVIFTYRPNN